MGSVGSGNTQSVAQTEYRRINDVDMEFAMLDSKWQNVATLVANINKADNGRYDILSRSGGGDSGTLLYQDSFGSDDDAYEVSYQRTYANDNNKSEIQIYRFRHYEAGEW